MHGHVGDASLRPAGARSRVGMCLSRLLCETTQMRTMLFVCRRGRRFGAGWSGADSHQVVAGLVQVPHKVCVQLRLQLVDRHGRSQGAVRAKRRAAAIEHHQQHDA